MIARLKGILLEKFPDHLIIDVNGVGYRVGISLQTFQNLGDTGSELVLRIYHHITEVGQSLFGFLSDEDRALFEELITVKSIGPKMALGIQSGIPSADLIDAIIRQDTLSLSRVPGIGKKTAERIVLELRDRIDKKRSSVSVPNGTPAVDIAREALAALEALGYKKGSMDQVVSNLLRGENPPKTASDLIRAALQSSLP